MCPIIVTPGGGGSGGGSRPIRDFFKLSAALAHNITASGSYTVPAGYSLFMVGAALGATNTTGQIVATLNAVARQIFQLAESGGVAAAGSALFACNTPFPDVAANILGTFAGPTSMSSSVSSGQDYKKIDSDYIHRLDAGTVVSVTGTLTSSFFYGFLVADSDIVGGGGSSPSSAGVHFDNVQDITASGNFVAPETGTYYVTMVGPGGGGGGASTSNTSPGGGGGAGEIAWRWPVRLESGEVVPVTIPAGGAGSAVYGSGSPGAADAKFGKYVVARRGLGGANGNGTPGIGGGGGRAADLDLSEFDATKPHLFKGANGGIAGLMAVAGDARDGSGGGGGLGLAPNGGTGGFGALGSPSTASTAAAANSGAGGGAGTDNAPIAGAAGGSAFCRVEW